MAKSQVFKRGSSGDVSMNLTPMIDCTFQLILFFVLCSTTASSALAKLALTKPLESQAIEEKNLRMPNRAIVNVLSKEDEKNPSPSLMGQAKEYQIDGRPIPIGNTAELVARLKEKKAASIAAGNKEFFVEIRADWRVSYAAVEPVMLAAAEADIPKMSITALLNIGGK